jgi:hypothetical protein
MNCPTGILSHFGAAREKSTSKSARSLRNAHGSCNRVQKTTDGSNPRSTPLALCLGLGRGRRKAEGLTPLCPRIQCTRGGILEVRAQREAPLRGLGNIGENAKHIIGINMPESKGAYTGGINNPAATGKLESS